MARFLVAVAAVVAVLTLLAAGGVQAGTYGDCPFTGMLDGQPVAGELFAGTGIAGVVSPGEVNRALNGGFSWNGGPYGFDGFNDYDPVANVDIFSGQASNPAPFPPNDIYEFVMQGSGSGDLFAGPITISGPARKVTVSGPTVLTSFTFTIFCNVTTDP